MNDDMKPVLTHLHAACQNLYEICVELVDSQDARVVKAREALAAAEVAIKVIGRNVGPWQIQHTPPADRLAVLSKIKMPFGEYKDKAFDEVPLRYLDHVAGMQNLYGSFKTNLLEYLAHPTIAKLLEQELARRE